MVSILSYTYTALKQLPSVGCFTPSKPATQGVKASSLCKSHSNRQANQGTNMPDSNLRVSFSPAVHVKFRAGPLIVSEPETAVGRRTGTDA